MKDNVKKGRVFAGGDVSTKTIEDICRLLQCQPQDLIEWKVDLKPELSYENRFKNVKIIALFERGISFEILKEV